MRARAWSQFGRFAGSLAELGPSGVGLIAAPMASKLRRFDSDQSLPSY
jgi:hypothetical protein